MFPELRPLAKIVILFKTDAANFGWLASVPIHQGASLGFLSRAAIIFNHHIGSRLVELAAPALTEAVDFFLPLDEK